MCVKKSIFGDKLCQSCIHFDCAFICLFQGIWKNLRQVITGSCSPIGDGFSWETKEGSGTYDLTVEQLEQKKEKRLRTKEYQIAKPFSGSWCPLWSFGFQIGCHPPCTDEPRIPLAVGDTVSVTRWKKYWLYGDKTISKSAGDSSHRRSRGWFPRKCAVEPADNLVEHRKVKRSKNSPESKKDR